MTLVLASGWTFEWDGNPIGQLTSHGLKPSEETTDQTVFPAVQGTPVIRRKIPVIRGYDYELKGLRDTADAGQLAVETSAKLCGSASIGSFTANAPDGTSATAQATVSLTDMGGGGLTDTGAWGCTFHLLAQLDFA